MTASQGSCLYPVDTPGQRIIGPLHQSELQHVCSLQQSLDVQQGHVESGGVDLMYQGWQDLHIHRQQPGGEERKRYATMNDCSNTTLIILSLLEHSGQVGSVLTQPLLWDPVSQLHIQNQTWTNDTKVRFRLYQRYFQIVLFWFYKRKGFKKI